MQQGVTVIRRAVHDTLEITLTEPDWQVVLTGEAVGLNAAVNVESPGFAVNTPGN